MVNGTRGVKVTRICKNCQTPFIARLADVKRGWAKFCSKSCKAKEQERRTGQNAKYKALKAYQDDEAMYHEAHASNEMGWDGHKEAF